MALNGTYGYNMQDYARRLNNGRIQKVIEFMNQYNGILEDIPYKPSNLDTGHKETVRTGLPEVHSKAVGEGVPVSKSATKQVMFDMSFEETRSETPEDLLKIQPDPAGFRSSEALAAVEALAQKQAKNLFYGNSKLNPKEHMGLAAYYSDPSKASGKMMIDCGGTTAGAQTSLWLVGWSDRTVHGIFPKNTTAGIQHTDLGLRKKTYTDDDGIEKILEVYEDKWTLQGGLVVKDWRYAGRLCNIEVTDSNIFSEDASGAPTLVKAILQRATLLKNRLPSWEANFVWYGNANAITLLENQAFNRPNSFLSYTTDEKNQKKPTLLGFPIKKCQCIENTEEVISFS